MNGKSDRFHCTESRFYHPRTKYGGKVMFSFCLSVNWGGGGYPVASGPMSLPWPLVPCPFGGGGEGYPLSLVRGPFTGVGGTPVTQEDFLLFACFYDSVSNFCSR